MVTTSLFAKREARNVSGRTDVATFNLVYSDDALGCARRIEFEAIDADGALRIAQCQAPGRLAELWEGDRKLCTLRRVGPDGAIWEVGPCANTRQASRSDIQSAVFGHPDMTRAPAVEGK